MSFRPSPPLFLLFLLFSISTIHSQQKNDFGKLTKIEKSLKVYDKDSSAYAVVLYERGDNYFEVIDRRIRLVKEYHTKVKILEKGGFDYGTITIPIYKNGDSKEEIMNLKAVTHNGTNQYYVMPSEVFTKDLSEYKSEQSFTFPKLQVGSILEYSYKMISPFIFNFNGWDFQSEIPKIYSEFNARIPGNYLYNRTLIGSLKLTINDAKIKKACFHVEGYSRSADCEEVKYAMKDIPAFKADEEFMLSEKNYISRLDFELSQHNRLDGVTDNYTKTWKDVDQEFRGDRDIGRQLTKKGYFEKNVPDSLFQETDALIKAKNIYRFVQNHYTWNGKYGVYGKARVKNAFEERKGSASEINMSLINLLNAAEIRTNIMLISTRDSGLPKQSHPVMSDFNYSIAKVEIDGKNYLLDATDKFMPFGMLPYHTLNHYGRVMDFKNESYWFKITPESDNLYRVRANVKFDTLEGKAAGVLDVVTKGYYAVRSHKDLDHRNRENYIERLENSVEGDFKILSHNVFEEQTTKRVVSERFMFEVDNVLQDDMVYINPFFIVFFQENPFSLKRRNYPVDFGYRRNYKYQLSLSIPEGYNIHALPKKQTIQIGEQAVTLKFLELQTQGQISILFDLTLNSSHIDAAHYEALKNAFKQAIDIQKKSMIVFKKEDSLEGS